MDNAKKVKTILTVSFDIYKTLIVIVVLTVNHKYWSVVSANLEVFECCMIRYNSKVGNTV
jgi:hypothetical protein